MDSLYVTMQGEDIVRVREREDTAIFLMAAMRWNIPEGETETLYRLAATHHDGETYLSIDPLFAARGASDLECEWS